MRAAAIDDSEWRVQARCRSGDPNDLFVGGAKQTEAKLICRGCPVQIQCAAEALDNQLEFGIWGGLTERQRRALLKARPDVESWATFLAQDQIRRAPTGT
ncbi:WhiB family transcriptional regulator [Mycobacterium sp. TY815]|uniref:WhiB family transcriptional regulator n=1 Tax=Mycobacterium sp. TY815 TaxID=3050581 RepID=UPI0027426666|nr:WhiB family transcriptional regulator [Mycobacterium sp. TY815]MDP7707440.1 WhiB family transcriptional regulator [Mycobacterium sp. TY815]